MIRVYHIEQTGDETMMHGFGFNGFGTMGGYGSFGLIGALFSLVLTAAVIAGLVLLALWLVRRFSPGGTTQHASAGMRADLSPREVLYMRYARGEITREQYQQMLADLS
jgi:putative membrane protein